MKNNKGNNKRNRQKGYIGRTLGWKKWMETVDWDSIEWDTGSGAKEVEKDEAHGKIIYHY
jgi:hypothetical protein